ncbi:MAG: efflux RND transporter periplasmic adaptor subunit [Flavobacteriales bacterium]|jgi:Cu(I)/Ag(I) efflux system membrane fusion protein|nr:efflux RND transporter periplasmic adaptor subunit [Flavobacteriales bacterium]MBK6882538.1 efflux RND transporter periplasmic adaptor subunit [Flavobacteriales bacterium]MBK7101244.1 efflux RND transporter periplasmic adaptor subunit [Flavobacteriales bacterium]MBK7111953.1 efflux RND transporter periplasmic adaptor subunit [Flavobacteriales bacterium]HQW05438.1 efflux RND transporter periplasmic adaptor subunit [Flavobacteriales bacterium]
MKIPASLSRYRTTLIVVITLVVGLFLGRALFGGAASPAPMSEREGHDMKDQIWTCSMHPQIRMKQPGQCPICGMDLIPAASGDAEMDPMTVGLTEHAMKLANVRTMIVGMGGGTGNVRLTGKVVPDERRVYSQATHVAGRVEELLVNYTGETVFQGQELARVYSPELVTAQEELLQAARVREVQPSLYAAAREKLRNWKLTDAQIEAVIAANATSGVVPILADVSGVVVQKRADLGDYLKRGEVLYAVADLSKLWVQFDLYESDLAAMHIGDTVRYTVRSVPGKIFKGRITFIDPVVDPATRVARARVEVADGSLKPGMFAIGMVQARHGHATALLVPRSAVLWTGPRSVVYVKEGEGRFRMREVVLGAAMGNDVMIASGLEAGEEIVVNGTFIVDAAAQLNGTPSMMSPQGGPMPKGHDHGAVK